jgi:hypothetical protein
MPERRCIVTVSGYGSFVGDLAASQKRWDDASSRVVRAATGDDQEDLAGASVGMLTARRGYEASLAVIRSQDRMLGTLIDRLA